MPRNQKSDFLYHCCVTVCFNLRIISGRFDVGSNEKHSNSQIKFRVIKKALTVKRFDFSELSVSESGTVTSICLDIAFAGN